MNKRMGEMKKEKKRKRWTDGWMEAEPKQGGRKTAASALRLFFFSLQKFFAAGWERRPSVCLSLLFHVHPTSPIIYQSASPPSGLCNNGVKHLRLPGNYGRAKTAGQRGAAELRHPAISPCISISPSLPQMTSVLSV